MKLYFKSNRLQHVQNNEFCVDIPTRELDYPQIAELLGVNTSTALGMATINKLARDMETYAVLATISDALDGSEGS